MRTSLLELDKTGDGRLVASKAESLTFPRSTVNELLISVAAFSVPESHETDPDSDRGLLSSPPSEIRLPPLTLSRLLNDSESLSVDVAISESESLSD